jgi:hypothetical protein
MKFRLFILSIAILFINQKLIAQNKIKLTQNFDKVIVSPHIETVFIEGVNPSIFIENISVPIDKFKYELKKGTLQVYLEGAKTYTKNKKIVTNTYNKKVPLYKNKVVKIIVTYSNVNTFSLRGEEKITFKSSIKQNDCKLRIYGKSEVTINNINVNNLDVSIYGDSYLNIEKGTVKQQKFRAYGASKVMASDVKSKETKIIAYGNGTFQFNVSKKIKVSSYGEATVLYKGDAQLKKGIVIGESNIRKVF